MKYPLTLILFLLSFCINAQNSCIDSSSHIQYKSLLNDSLRIEKTILTKDNGKISIGYFLNGTARGRVFISKINQNGTLSWFKKIISPFAGGNSELESIAEAANGNIFVAAHNPQPDNKAFVYLVFSPNGNLLVQQKIGITNNPEDLSNATTSTSLICQFSTDSVLLVLMHPFTSGNQGMTLLIVSNNGQQGQAITYAPPLVTTFNSFYSKCRIVNNNIFLYGGTQFYTNGCMINSHWQPAYAALQIDWTTKEVISKKTFCSPLVGFDKFGNTLEDGGDNENTQIFFQSNSNIIYVRRIWGMEFNGQDTLTRIFKVSTFDSNFNHIKSDYICTPLKFNWTIDWDYSLFIDSINERHIYVHDLPNKKTYYAASDSTGRFILQKQLLNPATRKNFRTNFVSRVLEPGYFTTFDLVSSDNQQTYIDNFRILAKDTATTCFGDNVNFLVNRPAIVSPINWSGNFAVQQAVIESAATNFLIEDYSLQRNIVCNIVHKCDTIKLTGPAIICDITQPVIFTVHKNPLCSEKIEFTFDTTQAQSYHLINDTTLSLFFNKSYKGKVFARINSCNLLKDSIEITVIGPQQINLGNDSFYCPGKNYLLSAYNPTFQSYNWQDGSTDSIYHASASGKYYVTATDYCNNTYSDTLRIIEKDFHVNLGKDTTVCINEEIILSVPAGYLNYDWQPVNDFTSLNPHSIRIKPVVNSSYNVEAEVFSGCKLSDTINVVVESCPEYIYFPNSFTPNNDGLNDSFQPLVGAALEKYELLVYNRWGQLVFKTNIRSEGWSGQLNGRKQDPAAFVWLCKYKFYGQSEKFIHGTVTLIR